LIAAGKLEALPIQDAGNGGVFDQYMGGLAKVFYDPNLVIDNDRGEVKKYPLMNDEWVSGVRGKMKIQIAEYLADRYGRDPGQITASLIEPDHYYNAEQRDAGGVSDTDLQGAAGFRNPETGGIDQYRVYPKDKTYEIQLYDEETGEWGKAPGNSGDSASLMAARNNGITDAERERETRNIQKRSHLENLKTIEDAGIRRDKILQNLDRLYTVDDLIEAGYEDDLRAMKLIPDKKTEPPPRTGRMREKAINAAREKKERR
jgi:hypothetical protein